MSCSPVGVLPAGERFFLKGAKASVVSAAVFYAEKITTNYYRIWAKFSKFIFVFLAKMG